MLNCGKSINELVEEFRDSEFYRHVVRLKFSVTRTKHTMQSIRGALTNHKAQLGAQYSAISSRSIDGGYDSSCNALKRFVMFVDFVKCDQRTRDI